MIKIERLFSNLGHESKIFLRMFNFKYNMDQMRMK